MAVTFVTPSQLAPVAGSIGYETQIDFVTPLQYRRDVDYAILKLKVLFVCTIPLVSRMCVKLLIFKLKRRINRSEFTAFTSITGLVRIICFNFFCHIRDKLE